MNRVLPGPWVIFYALCSDISLAAFSALANGIELFQAKYAIFGKYQGLKMNAFRVFLQVSDLEM